MAAYISVPRDLTKVKSKVLFNLTKRQLICFSIAAAVGVPLYFLIRRNGNTSLAALAMVLIMLPMFFIAMYERDGQPLEVILRQVIQAAFVRPKVRPYKTDNYYDVLMRQYEAEKEVKRIVSKVKEKGKRLSASGNPDREREKGSQKRHQKSPEKRRDSQDRAAVHSVPAHVS